jgi:hypothetical protein
MPPPHDHALKRVARTRTGIRLSFLLHWVLPSSGESFMRLDARSRGFLALGVALGGLAGCPGAVQQGDSCESSADCAGGKICHEGKCVNPCNSDNDCRTKAEVCIQGLCQRVANAECESDSGCTSPAPCQHREGAACVAGFCVYGFDPPGTACEDGHPCTIDETCTIYGECLGVVDPCVTPPDPECVDHDQTYRTYAVPGYCLPARGGCEYTEVDFPCPSCAVTCLSVCAGVICVESNGGCQVRGVCVPEGEGTCVYEAATDGTPCDLPEDPAGSLNGVCLAGQCGGCAVDTDCTAPPGAHPECYTARCAARSCAYDLVPSAVCAAGYCQAGVTHAERRCGDGSCPDAGSEACAPFRCNAAGTACLTTCSSGGDCTDGTFCNGGAGCVPQLDDGASCAGLGHSACLSGYCDGARCCGGGDCCNDPIDCPAAYTRASLCNDTTGATTCQGTRLQASCSNHACGSESIDDDRGCGPGLLHLCANHLAPIACLGTDPQSAPACPAQCTGSGDCESGYVCDGSHQCVLPSGVGSACTGGPGQGDCDDGLECENGVCCVNNGSTCCADPLDCDGGLACNLTTATCYETCSDFGSSSCADPAGDYCLANACVDKESPGSACSNAGECIHGFCVEGVCCTGACTSVCQSCRAALTGASDGTCAAIRAGSTDSAPTALCTATGQGCTGGSSCACDGAGSSAANCRRAVGQGCSAAADCWSGVCECAGEQCLTRKCAAAACGPCEYTPTGSGCTAGLGTTSPLDDPQQCDGVQSCYAGACRTDLGGGCTSGATCGSGICACGDPGCTADSKKCAAVACAPCAYTSNGQSCDGALTAGTPCDDGNACSSLDTCSGGGCVAGAVNKDTDGDTHIDANCAGGTDCLDSNVAVHPGASEGPGGAPSCSDGLDNDCDGDADGLDPACVGPLVEMSCNAAGWCLQHPAPTERDLLGIWGAAANDIWAVGEGGTILHYDGSAWSRVTSPTTEQLNAVFGSSANDVWAVGNSGSILRRQSGSWDIVTSFPGKILDDVWALDANHAWAVGSGIFAWDGSTWQQVSTVTSFRGVFGFNANDVWAVGYHVLPHHWNGSAWVPDETATTGGAYEDLWGTATNNLWMPEWFEEIGHYNGTVWTSEYVGSSPEYHGVWGLSANDVWFVGSEARHYDGTSLVLDPIDAPRAVLNGIWGATNTELWAVGEYGAILRRQPTGWLNVAWQDLGTSFVGVSGTGEDDVWAVGGGGSIMHFDGGGWSVVQAFSYFNKGYSDVWATAADNVWFAGSDGKVTQYTGTGLVDRSTSTDLDWYGIWASGPSDVWVVGKNDDWEGASMHWNGSAWSPGSMPVLESIEDVWGLDSTHVWAVEISGNVLFWNGATWSVERPGNSEWARGIWGTSANDIWVVGGSGLTLHRTGSGWTTPPNSIVETFEDVWGGAPNDYWAVGGYGAIAFAHWDGSAWTAVPSPSINWPHAVWGVPGGTVWAGCNYSTILVRP